MNEGFSPSRRRVLKALVGLGALAGFGGVLGKLRFTAESPDLPSLKHFSPTQAATLVGVYEVLFTAQERAFFKGGAQAFLKEADEVANFYPPYLREDLRLALMAVNLSPLFGLRFTPFCRLDLKQRAAILLRLEKSSLSELHLAQAAAREMCGFLHLGNPGVWRQIGYEGPMVN